MNGGLIIGVEIPALADCKYLQKYFADQAFDTKFVI